MRKIKLIAFLMSLTSCLTLISVGFSSWYNVSIPEKSVNGEIEAYDVLSIYIENSGMEGNSGMEMFAFSMFSFKGSDTEGKFANTDKGYIKVTYKIPVNTIESTDGSFNVSTTLGYDKSTVNAIKDSNFKGLFSSIGNGKNTVVVSALGGETTSHQVNNEEIINTFKFEGVSKDEDYEFTVTYEFNIPSEDDNFRKTFGQYLIGSKVEVDGETFYPTRFVASAQVSDSQ